MPARSSTQSEADLIFSRASLALATSQRLIASWLPPKTVTDNENSKTEEELEREEEEMFKIVPETLGLGAPLPIEGTSMGSTRASMTANDKLKKQLFGKDWRKVGGKPALQAKGHVRNAAVGARGEGHVAPKSRPQNGQVHAGAADDNEDDDGGGRSSLGKVKKRKVAPEVEGVTEDGNVANGHGDVLQIDDNDDMGRELPKRIRGSYLDEVLSERSRKKRKKKNRKRNKDAGST